MAGSEKSLGIGSAHGKVILVGEHTVVHGTPAIAFPVPGLRVSASVRRHVTGQKGVQPRGVETAVAGALRRWNRDIEGVDVALHCGVPPGRGLGASAACATAAVRAAADLHRVPLDARTLHELVQEGEHVAHGRASGVDARAVAADTPIWFAGGTARPLAVEMDASLVIADTGVTASTCDAVRRVRTHLAASPADRERTLGRAAVLVEAAADDLAAGDATGLGLRMRDFHELLAALGVSAPAVDRLVAAALAAGAAGAKLTGGGLGGCVLALAAPARDAAGLRAALERAGAVRTWSVPLGAAS
ncbi:mevalonate kinase [Actinomadura rubteroloni]|uniref:Mevalonate kinase n=1 Tax=Actinomadura rubteroloni TaxID=1926885 RepID=A0A2P4UEW9_9ACTN|nr:mevalonate kinase [Actinomadura rubteroloni]POM23585.1 mevalonate kinase [Actinomadura rubteroloni]